MQTQILLTTLNARYQHSSFGLRYLFANLGELKSQAKILEFTVNQGPRDIVETILSHNPKIVGFGVYIWNTRPIYEVISILKRVKPDILIVLGGPEVSHEADGQSICDLADYVIQGEADLLFSQFCREFVTSQKRPSQKRITGALPNLKELSSPYAYYTDEDIRNRVIYVEASRGCPYKCEYCLSSLDKSVRGFELERFLSDIDILIRRGAKQFKFVDRTFNLSTSISTQILRFFLDRVSSGLFIHFEMVPDRLPNELKDLISLFPPGSLQFEVGIQTWSPTVASLVSRRQDYAKIAENFSYLTRHTSVHLHADLIVGLPGETMESFAEGFDAVCRLNPHEIQVGILKRLKGTPISRHDQEWVMIYQECPPFQVLQTRLLPFHIIQKLSRFAQFWDLYANSGNFKHTLSFLKNLSEVRDHPSVFWEFYRFSEFLSVRHPQGNGIALINLVESAWIYFTETLQENRLKIREYLLQDYTGYIKRDIPPFLRISETASVDRSPMDETQGKVFGGAPKRQTRHRHSF